MSALVMLILVLGTDGILPVAAAGSGAQGPADSAVALQQSTTEEYHGATFVISPNVSEHDRYAVIEGIRLGQQIIGQYLGVEHLPNVRIYILTTADDGGDSILASTFGSEIEVYTGSTTWQRLSPIERVATLVHELTHVWQNLMIAGAVEPELAWFAEGTAEAIGFQAVISLGVSDQAEVYNLMFYMVTRQADTRPLSELEGFASMTAPAYPVSYLAVQYLLGSRGLSVAAIGAVYDHLAAGETFAQSFQATFGVSVLDFYQEFEAWRVGIERVLVLDDDFERETTAPQPSAITMIALPTAATVDTQLIMVGQTTPHAECGLDLALTQHRLRRTAIANGSGEVFWLVSLPEDIQPGPGAIMISCGADAVSGSLTIT
ncbi:MAG: hypothetical protein M9947_07995 [Thermomicrobiales bacterium]|nr:hypothetical protein [Thermomicrobiales bacterium]